MNITTAPSRFNTRTLCRVCARLPERLLPSLLPRLLPWWAYRSYPWRGW